MWALFLRELQYTPLGHSFLTNLPTKILCQVLGVTEY